MFAAGLSILIIYIIDTILVGLAFYSLKIRFKWKITPKQTFITLVICYAMLDNYLWPLIHATDLKIIIGNKEIAEFLDMEEPIPLLELFSPGISDFVIYCIQAFVGGIVGSKVLEKQ